MSSNKEQSFGLQWRLSTVFVAVSLLAPTVGVVAYAGGVQSGWQPVTAAVTGIAAGVVVGLVISVVGFFIARAVKLRLWEAGDMASRMARGDLSVRLPVGMPDEVGVLEEQLNGMAHHLERAVGDLRRLAEQNRQLAEEARRGAAVEERAKLARDLHDTVNQQLFVLAMRAAAARRRLEKLGGEASALGPELSMLEELARGAHAQARELILQLRPTTLEQQGIGPALAEYVTAAGQREGWEMITAIDTCVQLKGAAGEALFRIAQEALNNVSKHAQASTVWVSLSQTAGGIKMTVKDDGVGFDRTSCQRPTAVGLVGIRERVQALHGRLYVKSCSGEGTEVTVTLPHIAEGGNGFDPSDAGRRSQDGPRGIEDLPVH